MFISHLTLRNWKNFREADADLRPRVFILGPNAAGKSNFLDALRFLGDVAKEGLRAAVEDDRGGVSAIRCLAARVKSDIGFDVTLAADDGRPLWLYTLDFGQTPQKTPAIKREKVSDLLTGTTLLDRPNDADRADEILRTQTALEQIIANREFREIADFFKQIKYRHIIPQVVRNPSDFSNRLVEDDPYGRDFVSRVWNTPTSTRRARLERIQRILKVAVPQLMELDVGVEKGTTAPHLIVRYEHWRHHPARQSEAQMSDGTLRLLGLLWAMFEGEGPLLLEEPELSLHSELVRHLPELFAQVQEEIRRMRRRKASGRRQVIISTHSLQLLESPGIAAEEVLRLEPTPEGTQVKSASATEKELFLRGLTAADVMLPKTAPADSSQLLMPFH